MSWNADQILDNYVFKNSIFEHFVDTSRELKQIFHNIEANCYPSMQTNTNFIKSVRKIKWSKSKNISITYSRQGEHKFSFWLKVKKEYIFPATPSQSWGPVKPPPLLENLVGDSTSPPPPQQKGGGVGGGCTLWFSQTSQIIANWCL